MYLDSAILVKLLVREPDSTHWARLVDGQVVMTSALALTECFSALLRKEREGSVSARQRTKAWSSLEADVRKSRIGIIPVSEDVLIEARQVLEACQPLVALQSLDAIHLASARQARAWPLCTNDVRMRQAAIQLAVPLAPLPA